jgi:hypothetical protein
MSRNWSLVRWIVSAVVVTSVVVGIITAWPSGVAVLVLAVFVFGFGYSIGVSADATTRWSSALYGNDVAGCDSDRDRRRRTYGEHAPP